MIIIKLLEDKNDKVNNIYEDYYNNNIKEIYFYPFFNMDKDYKEKETQYKLHFMKIIDMIFSYLNIIKTIKNK